MKELILATKNRGKIAEIKEHLAGLDLNIRSLLDLRDPVEIDETGDSYSQNALLKATAAHRATGAIALADDSGLEIDALDGAPGVQSARYGGAHLTDSERNALILDILKDAPLQKRGARFVCVAIIIDEEGRQAEFTGILEGYIGQESLGTEGFGYDPIFHLPGSDKSLAQLGLAVKNRISHRAQAMRKARSYLQSRQGRD